MTKPPPVWHFALSLAILMVHQLHSDGGRWSPAGGRVVAGSASVSAPARGQADDPLDVRLGGTRRSFDAQFGTPYIVNLTALYDVPEYGLLSIFYRQVEAPDPDDRAVQIILRSPRPEDTPATSPHAADWPEEEARDVARRFLPTDADLASQSGVAEHVADFGCRSDDLAEVFAGDQQPGSCRVSFVSPTPGTVSFITLSATGGDAVAAVATPVDPCSGMTEWSTETGRRLNTTEALLTGLGDLNEADPGTPAALRRSATRFSTLADEQGEGPIPSAAVGVNRLLVAAFGAYSAALDRAATAAGSADVDALDDATALLEATNTDYAGAGQLVRTALTACGLLE